MKIKTPYTRPFSTEDNHNMKDSKLLQMAISSESGFPNKLVIFSSCSLLGELLEKIRNSLGETSLSNQTLYWFELPSGRQRSKNVYRE